MIDIGICCRGAHGQAMISTATAFTRPCSHDGDGPMTPRR